VTWFTEIEYQCGIIAFRYEEAEMKDWWIDANELALSQYGVTLDDLGYEDGDEIDDGGVESPEAYVERKAEKYGLEPLSFGVAWYE
jgi:hypothetical protein